MIDVGLTSVAEHPTLAATGKASTLADLAGVMPLVELDTTFYHIPAERVVRGWQQQVPASFQFIVKATEYMTLHKEDGQIDLVAQFTALKRSLQPLIASHQLAAILFQWPPFFGATPDNVRYLQRVRRLYPALPIACEFRNNGWYGPVYRATTLDLLRTLQFVHVVVDEPQTAAGSVPLVATATNADYTIMRLHGRNVAGWQDRRVSWRKSRTDYRYSAAELQSLGDIARGLASKRVSVIFNNNGGGAAADNALAFIAQEGLKFAGLGPHQLGLF